MKQKLKYFLITIYLITIYNNQLYASDLKWNSSTGGVSGYTIYYGLSQGSYPFSEDVGNVTQYSLDNFSLSEGTTYYFVVRAYNASGESGDSNETTYAVPSAGDTTPTLPPEGVFGEVVSEDILLTWQANSEIDISGYRVYYGTSSRDYGLPIPVEGTEYSIAGLASDVTYYFSVSAVDASGNESGYSSPEIIKTITAIDEGDNLITVTATDETGNTSTDTLTITYTIPDTTAPVVTITFPTTGTTYGTQSDSINLSGTSSDDTGTSSVTWISSRGVSGTATGTTSWSALGISLSEGNNVITMTATDAAGNTSTDVVTVTYTRPDTTAPVVTIPSPTKSTASKKWTRLTYDNFESGWGSFRDGGRDCRRIRSSKYAHRGKKCVRIRDNSGKRSSFYSVKHNIKTPGYSQIKVRFWYYPESMEPGEDFFVEFYNGNRWIKVARYKAGKDFRNKSFYRERGIIINKGPKLVFSKKMRIRFRCDATNDKDRVYIDQVVVSAR